MKKNVITLIILLIANSFYSYSQNMPITTKSDKALESYMRGWQLEDQLELDAAEIMYKEAIALDSTFALAYLRLGMVKDNYDFRRAQLKLAIKNMDNVTKAEKLWIKARQDFYSFGFDGSKEYGYFQKLVNTYPNDATANYLFGFVNLHHGEYKPELAIAHLKKAIELKPNFIKPYNELAYAYMEASDFENAKIAATNYIKMLPKSVNPLDTYAEILMRNGEYKKSIEKYKNALDINPEFPWAFIGIAANMNYLGRYEEGRTYINRINEEILNDYEYRHKWRALVTSYIEGGNLEEAIRVLEQQKQASLKGLNKREPVFHIYYSFLRKTRLYFENNQPEKGFNEYKNWKQYVDNNITRESTLTRLKNLEYYYQAYVSYSKNNLEEAEKQLQLFNQLNDEETEDSKVLLSKIYISKKMYAAAITKLKETDMNNSYNQYWLMEAFHKNGDILEVKKWKAKIINFNDRNNIDLALVRRKAMEIDF